MKTDFPFELVYKYIAHRCLQAGLPKDGVHEPLLMTVIVDQGEVVDIDILPGTEIFFGSDKGKDFFGQFLRRVVPALPANTCLVLISEAYRRRLQLAPGQSAKEARNTVPKSLANDPLAEEVLSIQIFRPLEHRSGHLPIAADRSLKYEPLDDDNVRAEGRLVPESTQIGAKVGPQWRT